MAFISRHKDKMPIFKQSLLIYKFECRISSTCKDHTCQRLEVKIRQYVPRGIITKGIQTSGNSQAMDSAIEKHLLAINSCRINYQDDCFSVLHRDRDNIHLNVLEAIYITIDHPSLCRQLSSHILNTFGEILETGVTWYFFVHLVPSIQLFSIHPVFNYSFRWLILRSAGRKGPRCFFFF